MISWIKGNIINKNENSVIINSGNVGYKVFVSEKTYFKIKDKKEVEFYTHTHVREDMLDLYGFETYDEMIFFEAILSVSGIGPKVGLAILAQGSVTEIKRAIASSDILFFNAVSGIGKKKAERFIMELKDKIEVILPEKESANIKDSEEVIEALKQLGYTNKEAIEIVRQTPDNLKRAEDKITWALKNIGNTIINKNC
ncbi:MAG: Holliday junction branch migration protein RuvA [Parcubacteria group bacterium]|nr:Holliday junction branch migration protein RuvA [Parcubacteria group bacterium]